MNRIATTEQKNSQEKAVPPAVIALAVAGVLAFAAFIGYRTLGPAPLGQVTTVASAEQKADNDFLKQLAKRTGGDISKASAEEVRRLQKFTRGQGEMALKGAAAMKQ